MCVENVSKSSVEFIKNWNTYFLTNKLSEAFTEFLETIKRIRVENELMSRQLINE